MAEIKQNKIRHTVECKMDPQVLGAFLLKELDKQLIKSGKIPQRMLPIAKEISELKKKKTISPSEIQRIKRDASELVDALTEYTQRKDLVIRILGTDYYEKL